LEGVFSRLRILHHTCPFFLSWPLSFRALKRLNTNRPNAVAGTIVRTKRARAGSNTRRAKIRRVELLAIIKAKLLLRTLRIVAPQSLDTITSRALEDVSCRTAPNDVLTESMARVLKVAAPDGTFLGRRHATNSDSKDDGRDFHLGLTGITSHSHVKHFVT
jgi:hypothetical protein